MSSYIDHYGYRHIKDSSTSRVHKDGYTKEHFIIAEKTLGRPLPVQVVIHHINEIKSDNSRTNLVICEDENYHRLLHARQRIVFAGGNPDKHKICSKCKKLFA